MPPGDKRAPSGPESGHCARAGDPGSPIVAGTLLAGLLVLPVTLAAGYYIAVVTTRFGLDPDNQGVPIITSLMDLVGVAAILFAMGVSGVIVHG